MIKSYQEYLNESLNQELTQEQKKWLDPCIKGTWALNPQTGLVDVDGSFYRMETSITDLRGIKFGNITGDFICCDNYITSLEGSPQKVGGDFNCSHNELTSLEGSPQEVDGFFKCYGNSLTDLKGAPQKVGGGFICYKNRLTSLEGLPQEITGRIDLRETPIFRHLDPLTAKMSDVEKRFFLKFVGASEATDKESLERIARSIERMRMI